MDAGWAFMVARSSGGWVDRSFLLMDVDPKAQGNKKRSTDSIFLLSVLLAV